MSLVVIVGAGRPARASRICWPTAALRSLCCEPFQFAFTGFLKVAFQGSRITSDAGLLLVRELDERLGLETLISEI